MAEFKGKQGVWRTVGGRRIFIADGEDLKTAMEKSGKFKNLKKDNKEEKNDKFLQKAVALNERDKGKISEEEYFNKLSEIDGLDPEKEKIRVRENLERLGVEVPDYLKNKNQKENKRTTKEVNDEYDKLSKKMQEDGYYYRSEDDRKLKELRAEYDTLVAKGQEDVNLSEYNEYKEMRLEDPSNYTDDDYKKFNELDKKYLDKFSKEEVRAVKYGDKYAIIQNGGIQKEFDTAEEAKEFVKTKTTKEKTGNDYLPKTSEIKEQGKSNRKEVSDNIQAHILEYYDNPVDFMEQMDAVDYLPTKWKQGEYLAKSGNYLIYNGDMSDFLDTLKINPKGKTFSEDKAFDMYTSLVGRESANLYNRLEKMFDEYKKDHKNSNATLNDFRKWFK